MLAKDKGQTPGTLLRSYSSFPERRPFDDGHRPLHSLLITLTAGHLHRGSGAAPPRRRCSHHHPETHSCATCSLHRSLRFINRRYRVSLRPFGSCAVETLAESEKISTSQSEIGLPFGVPLERRCSPSHSREYSSSAARISPFDSISF